MWKWLKKVNRFLRKHRVLSRGANLVGRFAPGKYGAIARKAGRTASALGYGLSLPGGALRLAGARGYGRRRRRRRRHRLM